MKDREDRPVMAITSGHPTERLDVSGLDVAYVQAGRGDPALVLVHGFTGSKEDFADHMDWLGRRRRVIAFDHRGHGESAWAHSYSFDLVRRDLAGVVDSLGLERFVLLGHSMGGFVAQLYALAAPERLAGLVLMGTGPGPLRLDPDSLQTAGLARHIALEAGMEALLTAQKALAESESAPDVLASEADEALRRERPGYLEFCDAKFLATDPRAYDGLLGDILAQDDRTDALRSLDVPTLVVVGDEDRAFRKAARRMAEAIPGARFAEIAGAGHSPQFEAPQPWRDSVGSFLDDLEDRP